VRNLNEQERVSFLLAEQNTIALRFANFGYILENGAWSWKAMPSNWRKTKT
jgi:ABC-type branched-subunit amino acid transport system ATPase component